MFTRLMESLAATAALSQVFSDESVLQAMLAFETALARAEASAGIISAEAAEAVVKASVPQNFDMAELVRQAFRAGTPAIPLAKILTAKAPLSHWGATSQDVTDTALALLLVRCRGVLEADHNRLLEALRNLSDRHADSVMLGRTLLQPAPPVTFGLKAAGWFASAHRGWSRVEDGFHDACCLQFGGASGTLAAFDGKGISVSRALAGELGLKCPDAPWHGHRDRLAALMAALCIYTGSLGKMALDVALLMQAEVGEASEPGGDGRGGSSAMPHKRNPTACMLTLAAARRTPGFLANFLSGMPQEQERGLGGWQNEWSTVESIVQATGVALESMVEVAEGLTVDVDRMRSNLQAAGAAIFSEREKLQKLLGNTNMSSVTEPEEYLGSAEQFRLLLLEGKD